MPDLRPPKPKAVKSIKDLKREIEERTIGWSKNPEFDPIAITGRWVLELINSFEAGLRERLNGKEVQSRDWLIRETIEKELHRVLGEDSKETTVKECVKHEPEWVEDDYGTNWLVCKKCGETLKEESEGGGPD